MKNVIKDNAADPVQVSVQYASKATGLPEQAAFSEWVTAALDGLADPVEVVVRIVDEEESARLNETYRDKAGPTNVLSFSLDTPPEVDVPLLGDLVICAPLIRMEAEEQNKQELAHWAHIVVHGVLHLLGYDHDEPKSAERMERQEVEILERLGYGDPYV